MSASHHVFQNLGRRWKERDPTLVGVLMVLGMSYSLLVTAALRS